MTDVPERLASESYSEVTQMVMPNDTNPRGNVFGGRVLEWIDICGAMCASRHSRCQVVTASLAGMSFLSPIKLGHFVILTASLNRTGRTSMGVTVRVESEDPITGRRKHCSTAELTYVALDADGQPVQVPRLKVEG